MTILSEAYQNFINKGNASTMTYCFFHVKDNVLLSKFNQTCDYEGSAIWWNTDNAQFLFFKKCFSWLARLKSQLEKNVLVQKKF